MPEPGTTGMHAAFEIPPKAMQQIPAMPSVASRIFQMVERPDTDALDIGRAISMDPMLTAKVLKTANSSYYSPTQPILNVTQAVTRMGFRSLRNLVLVECLPFRNRSGPADALGLGLWEHAVGTAIGARLLAAQTAGCSPEDAFVAGLLHDIGKSALAVVHPGEYGSLAAAVQASDRTFYELEQERWGYDHAEVGGAVLAQWQLPESFVEGVRTHHRPQAGPHPTMWACVDLASRTVKTLGLGVEKRLGAEVALGPVARLLNFKAENWAALQASLQQAYDSEKAQFQL